jgi:hypothetical protein
MSAFGGVPMSVPTPPMELPYAMPSSRHIANGNGRSRSSASGFPASASSLRTISITEMAIGIIITAVAVFETNIDRNAQAIMNPATSRPGATPTARMIQSAMRRCSPHCCIARASMNPPMKR